MRIAILSLVVTVVSVASGQVPVFGELGNAVEINARSGIGRFAAKAMAGRSVSVAYFGGSITEMDGWRRLSMEWLRKRFPKSDMTELAAAIGGTGSGLGVFRIGRDVLASSPDLVFIEFACNDTELDPLQIWENFDGIVRQIWRKNPETDIVFVYVVTAGMMRDYLDGRFPRATTAQDMLADHYGIPSVSFGPAVASQYKQGRLVMSMGEMDSVVPRETPDRYKVIENRLRAEGRLLFAWDGVHPTLSGHGIYMDVLVKALDKMISKKPADVSLRQIRPYYSATKENAKLVPIRPSMLKGHWRKLPPDDPLQKRFERYAGQLWMTDTPGDSLTFKYRGGLSGVYDLLGPDCGRVLISVNGREGAPIDRFDAYSADYRLAGFWCAGGADEERTIKITLDAEQPDRNKVKQVTPSEDVASKKYNGTKLVVSALQMVGDVIEEFAAETTVVHVAPDGDDANPGTKELPLATAEGARDAVRRLRVGETPPFRRMKVVFADGVYAFSKPLELDERDSNVVWLAEKRGGAVVWSGARRVESWHPVDDPAVLELLPKAARKHVCMGVVRGTDLLPGFRGGGCGTPDELQETPMSLFQGTNRLELARWPNPGDGDGYARAGKPLGPFEERHDARYSIGGTFAFDTPRLAAWAKEPEPWAYGLWCYEWADAKARIEAVDCEKKTLRIDMGPVGFGLREGCQFQVINALSELDRPGEWVIDRARRRVYVWPLPGNEEPQLAMSDGLVRATRIDDSCFGGIVFEETRGGALVISKSKGVYMRCCAVRRTSSWGVVIDGCTDCHVEGCDLHDLGEGGILLSGGDFATLTPGRNVADNNHIHHYGNVIPNYRPGISLLGVGNVCTHNLIHHTRHQAIAFGGNDHRIAFNVMHDTCMYNKDAGTIYCCQRDWSQRGTVIENNLLHMTGRKQKSVGTDAIYLDDFSSGVIVRNNLINRASMGVRIGGGQDCLVTGNVILNCTFGIHLGSRGIDSFARDTSGLGRKSYLFRRLERDRQLFESPLWRNRYPNLLRVYDFEDAQFAHNALYNVITNNVLASCDNVDKLNWEKIAPYCTVENNLVLQGDPGFKDYFNFEWELKNGEAKGLVGDLRFAEMGLYQDKSRFSPAVKFGADVTSPRPIHVEYYLATVRIDLKHEGPLPSGETVWAEATKGCYVPGWGGGAYVVAQYGDAAEEWRSYSFSFTPRFDCSVRLTTMGTRGEKTLYDDFRVVGANLANPGFEGQDGWSEPVDNPQDARASVCNNERPYGRIGAREAGCEAAEGKMMACGNDMLNFSQTIQVKKGVRVSISFKARALPLK